MQPEQLARLVGFLRRHPDAAMVYADYVAIDDRGEPLADPSFRPQNRRPATSAEIHLPRDPREINVVRDNFIGPCFLYRSIVGRLLGDYDPGLGIEDYDYWMRVNHAFHIEHLGTDETLYRYRVHDRSLSGRAVELKIAERAAALMKTERTRSRSYREPWTVLVDDRTDRRLAGLRAVAPSMAGPPGSPLSPSDREGKVLYLADSTRLDALAAADRPDAVGRGRLVRRCGRGIRTQDRRGPSGRDRLRGPSRGRRAAGPSGDPEPRRRFPRLLPRPRDPVREQSPCSSSGPRPRRTAAASCRSRCSWCPDTC